MDIIITQWALDSYLELKSKRVFDEKVYREVMRPDVLLLSEFPKNPKFGQGKFWSVAQDKSGKVISNGYKMKWHQMGNGLVQVRLTVGIFNDECFLCEAYVKSNESQEHRKLEKFRHYLELIKNKQYVIRGRLL